MADGWNKKCNVPHVKGQDTLVKNILRFNVEGPDSHSS